MRRQLMRLGLQAGAQLRWLLRKGPTERARVGIVIGSFPERKRSLTLTIKSLLTQSVAATSLTIVLGDQDQQYRQFILRKFGKYGLRVVTTPAGEDWLGYKKFFPSEVQEVDFVITLDDDIALAKDWLQTNLKRCRPGTVNATRGVWVSSTKVPAPFVEKNMSLDMSPKSTKNRVKR